MPGALDSAFRKAAKAVVAELGSGLDVEIDYVREFVRRLQRHDWNVYTIRPNVLQALVRLLSL